MRLSASLTCRLPIACIKFTCNRSNVLGGDSRVDAATETKKKSSQAQHGIVGSNTSGQPSSDRREGGGEEQEAVPGGREEGEGGEEASHQTSDKMDAGHPGKLVTGQVAEAGGARLQLRQDGAGPQQDAAKRQGSHTY